MNKCTEISSYTLIWFVFLSRYLGYNGITKLLENLFNGLSELEEL